MKNFYNFSQNNSGGHFEAPAINVLVEAGSLDVACTRIAPHVTLCGDSGLYADYDVCGCCPCCGHRWTKPWNDEPEIRKRLEYLFAQNLEWLGGINLAVVKADGTLIVADTREKLDELKHYVLED